jgi:hypothetical protein
MTVVVGFQGPNRSIMMPVTSLRWLVVLTSETSHLRVHSQATLRCSGSSSRALDHGAGPHCLQYGPDGPIAPSGAPFGLAAVGRLRRRHHVVTLTNHNPHDGVPGCKGLLRSKGTLMLELVQVPLALMPAGALPQ